MQKTTKTLLIIGSVLLFLTGAGLYVYYNIKKALDFLWKITDCKFTSISSSGIKGILTIRFKNKADIGITMTAYDLDVSINGIHLANVKSYTKTVIEGMGVSEISVPFDVKRGSLDASSITKLGALALLYANKNNYNQIIIKTKGTFSGSVLKLKVENYPVEFDMTYAEIIAPSTTTNEEMNF